ncbi:MAG: NAD(P)/FAD-dependent oxidoreductase [Cyclobacteriaceae bacterium]|uniref:NAD(P)/FAD-dependent oxidoreductase n=1 Tax=Croceimicrobium sp. TaxID=2828340 RepID=UPI0029C16857|nr:NAD(P)/FAD-dependent oxidoreductase [Cyclobacteriaceae bacterium]
MEVCNTGQQICLSESSLPRVVIIGGGFAGIELSKKLKNGPYQVVLLDRHNFHQFQPLLYQVATSGLEPDSIVFPFRKMFSGYKNFVFRLAEVQEVEPLKQRVFTDKGYLDYDYLVLATGSQTNYFGLSQVQENSTGMKNIREALNIRHLMLQNLEKATITCDAREKDILTNFIIVGGGPAGVETAGALAEFRNYILPKDYPELVVEDMNIYLLEAGDRLLNGMSDKASDKALKYLRKLGVEVELNTALTQYNGKEAQTQDGRNMEAATLVWTAGVMGSFPKGMKDASILRANRIETDKYLRVKGYINLFATGDVAAVDDTKHQRGHPMVAQVAIQQGRLLGDNLLRLAQGKKFTAFIYKDKGSLATIGKNRAVADIAKFRFGGYVAWLLWSIVHLMSISGFKNKLFVGLNWLWSYFNYEKSNRLIIRKYDLSAERKSEIFAEQKPKKSEV